MMKTFTTLAICAAMVLPLSAAKADDASYCSALNSAARGVTPGGGSTVPTSVAEAMTKCNADSMKVLEKYITDNKGTVPKKS